MTYQEQSDNYRNEQFRNRAEMCIREQGVIYTEDEDPELAALGIGVTGGNWSDIDAIMMAVATGPNGTTAMTDDVALLSAVQAAWPVIAAAKYSSLLAGSPAAMAAGMPMPMTNPPAIPDPDTPSPHAG